MDERAAIEQVMREYFSFQEGQPSSPSLTTGKLRDWLENAPPRSVDEYMRYVGEIEELQVDYVEGRTATAVLAATRHAYLDTPHGQRRTYIGRYAGPVVLEKVGDEWKIVDYAYNGQRVLDGLWTGLDTRQEIGALAIRVFAVKTTRDGALVALELRNDGDAEARLAWAAGRARFSWQHAWVDQALTIPPGESRTTSISFGNAFSRRGAFRFLLDVESEDSHTTFDVIPSLGGRAILPPPSRLPRSAKLHLSHWRPIFAIVAMIAAFYAFGLGSWVPALLIAAGVLWVWTAIRVARRSGFAGRVRLAFAIGLVLLVVGGVLRSLG